ncbi:MAG: hypothetical protein ACOZIN_17525 [Myxococcota bacterium]
MLAYEYFADGAVRSRHDVLLNSSEDFEYDFADRLTKWTHAQDCQRSVVEYEYDDGGNMRERRVLEGPLAALSYSYGEGGAGPGVLTSVTTSAGGATQFGYDANGNQTSAGARVVDAYTPFNLPRTMRVQGVSTGFEYDAFGTRVRKSSGTDETVYVEGLYEKRMASLVRTHVYSASRPTTALSSARFPPGASWADDFR